MSTINNQQVHLLPFLFPFGLVFQNKPLDKQEQVWPKNLPPATLAFCTFPRSALWEISLKGIYLSPCK